MFGDVTSVALRVAMSGLAARQRATADNVANIATPGFLAGRVQFEDSLRDAVRSGDVGRIASSGSTTSRSLEPTREDGNNVNLDTESISGTDTVLRYQLLTQAVTDRMSLLRTAMRTS
ncbi:flagellar basal body rod protein FlgB [Pseudokineococcus lusitanus]|uniref:Flagellar basal body rod protein FlgB n=1 Tax=Pseudokineococcus lusitanus TaxID=763993 RepID=A0A3N1HQQ9_9ACTN|nr:flagellar basal body protein [Pseudokineococcus lusitanus]ROP44843.1 flagellar basal-body rod protein FlgB [Pseudokineococcus lusitanus]